MALNVLTAHQAAQQSEGQQVSRAPDKVSRGPDTLTDSSQAGQSSLSADELHALVEACRLAFADALEWVADPVAHELPLAELSCARRAAARYQAHYSPHKVWARPAGWWPAWAVQAVQAVQGGAATHMCHAWHALVASAAHTCMHCIGERMRQHQGRHTNVTACHLAAPALAPAPAAKACRPEPDASVKPPGPARTAQGGDTCQWVVRARLSN
jgi:hypothetical protein